MTVDPEVINIGLWPRVEHHTSRLDDEWAKWQAVRAGVDKILARAGMFQGVEPRAVSALTAELRPIDFRSGHAVFAEGEPGDRLYIVISGQVKIGRRSPDGRENLLIIMGPSDMVSELSTFDPGLRTSSATTITDAPSRSVRTCGRRRPGLS